MGRSCRSSLFPHFGDISIEHLSSTSIPISDILLYEKPFKNFKDKFDGDTFCKCKLLVFGLVDGLTSVCLF
jgi:hypothetical protein